MSPPVVTHCRRIIGFLLAAVHLASGPAPAQDLVTQDLKRLTLEELLRVEVSTVLRAPEPTTDIPAAVFIITQDDIRRSGATSLPEILRLAPGMQVARIDSARYAVGMRGFADRLARSMLVLVDGRAVYSPLFAGTYWEVQDVLLADIDRIEIIRGPGGTLWGANAVNGIINIITRRALDTQGTLVTANLGTDLQGPLGIRYGGHVSPNFHFRVYGKGFDRDPQAHPDSADYDEWRMAQGGFRGDWSLRSSRTLTVQGDLYAAELGQRVTRALATPPFAEVSVRESPLSGGNVLARWSSAVGSGEYALQSYYDRTSRDEQPVAETRHTFDLDFQHRRPLTPRHSFVWGAGYRVTSDRITSIPPTAFVPANRTDHLFTAFAQDDFSVVAERLRVVFGAKIGHDGYSGFEAQPSARVMWTVNSSNALFAAATRAVRTPSRVETDFTTTSLTDPAGPTFVRLQTNPEFEAEKLTAYELGYRVRPRPTVYVTASAFLNHLDDILSTEPGAAFVETTPAPPRIILPIAFGNGLHGSSHGVEITADVRPVSWWRWTGNYSYVRIQMTRDPGSADVSQERRNEGLSPRHQVHVHSSIDLPRGISLDWLLRYASELPAGPVPAYATSTVRLAWQPVRALELALVGRNLHEPRHLEFPAGSGANVEIRRAVHVHMTWRP